MRPLLKQDGSEPAPEGPPAAPRAGKLRQLAPWLIGLVILVVLALRIPYAAFSAAIGHGPHLTLAVVDLLVVLLTLGSESVGTWVSLFALGVRRPIARLFAVRGATFVLVLINYAVGQGGFGYYLHRTGLTPLRAVGTTLFLIGINFAMLIVIMPITWMIDQTYPPPPTLRLLVAIGCAAFAVYLLVIKLAPAFLTKWQVFAPLFDAGWRGHAIAMVGRLPHMAMIVIGQWAAMNAWGIHLPFGAAMTVMPAVTVVSSLPISPAGLGTSQAALIYFFANYASGATSDERAANVLAYSIVHLVYCLLASVLVGLACTPAAKRATA